MRNRIAAVPSLLSHVVALGIDAAPIASADASPDGKGVACSFDPNVQG